MFICGGISFEMAYLLFINYYRYNINPYNFSAGGAAVSWVQAGHPGVCVEFAMLVSKVYIPITAWPKAAQSPRVRHTMPHQRCACDSAQKKLSTIP